MAEEGLNESTVTLVLLDQGLVLGLEAGGLLDLDGDFAFELTNVF